MTVVLKKFSCRTVVAIGGFFNALSHIISGITKNIRVFYFSNGLIGGNVLLGYLTCLSLFQNGH